MNTQSDRTAAAREQKQSKKILEIKDLSVVFPVRQGAVTALEDIELDIYRGETLGIVGESGSGKSTLAFSILRAIQKPGRIVRGKVLFHGKDLLSASNREMNNIRGKRISMIFQDPMTSLNPLMRIDRHIIETIRVHEREVRTRQARARASNLLKKLGISEQRLFDYPHSLSGGMRQRVMIGIGLSLNAELLIADEPTTSLDVIVEAQFIDLLKDLKKEFGLTLLLITHNMGIVAQISDRIAVMYGARLVEVSPSTRLFENPLHPYTEGLLRSVPNIRMEEEKLESMPGFPPDLLNPSSTCRFAPRCKYAFERCFREMPPLYRRGERLAACFKYAED